MLPRWTIRFAKAQEMMRQGGLDVLLVTNRENLIYFSGVAQIECMAIVIPREGEPRAVTLQQDRDFVADASGLVTDGYAFPRENIVDKVIERINAFGYPEPRIGFERYFVGFPMYDGLRRAFRERDFIGAGDLFYLLRAVKDAGEIESIRNASRAVSLGMEAAVKAIVPGIAELEILAEAEYAMLRAGSWGAPFRPQVVSGDRTLLAHPCASGRRIRFGEIVVLHLGATCEGYCSKLCRTVAVGNVPGAQREVYEVLLAAQGEAMAAMRPGSTSVEVDAAARNVVEKAGFGDAYLDVVGYGVGLRQSEFYPIIGKGRTERIEEGMVIDLLLPTILRSGIGGPRVTDVVHVGKLENEVLTRYPREWIRV